MRGSATTMTESWMDSGGKGDAIRVGPESYCTSAEFEPARNLQAGQGPVEGNDGSLPSAPGALGQSLWSSETVDVIAT